LDSELPVGGQEIVELTCLLQSIPVSATPELVAAGSSRQPQSIVISAEFHAESAAQFLISTELDGG
jgi:hypothetical protein